MGVAVEKHTFQDRPPYIDETLLDYPIVTSHPELKPGEFLKVLVPEQVLKRRIAVVAAQIQQDFRLQIGIPWLIVPLYKGADFFMKNLQGFLSYDLVWAIKQAQVRSRNGMAQNKELEFVRFPSEQEIVGKHVLLIDGVGDSFFTAGEVYEKKLAGVAGSCALALLADKTKATDRKPLPVGLELRYTAFQFGNPWLVGASADYHQRLRGLPYLAELVGAK